MCNNGFEHNNGAQSMIYNAFMCVFTDTRMTNGTTALWRSICDSDTKTFTSSFTNTTCSPPSTTRSSCSWISTKRSTFILQRQFRPYRGLGLFLYNLKETYIKCQMSSLLMKLIINGFQKLIYSGRFL